METFKERFEKRAKALGTREIYVPGAELVDLPPEIRKKYKSGGAAVFAHGKKLIDAAEKKYPAVALNSVYFLKYGVSGIIGYSAVITYSQNVGMLVICDERLTITEDNADYAVNGYLKAPTGEDLSETGQIPLEEHGFNVDAITVSPGSSKKGLQRLSEAALASGREIMTPGENGVLKGILSGLELKLN